MLFFFLLFMRNRALFFSCGALHTISSLMVPLIVIYKKFFIIPTLLPGPCSHFYFDINFGNRLYSKEKRPGSSLLF